MNNPFTLMSDQDIISPFNICYNIKQTSDESKEKYQVEDF